MHEDVRVSVEIMLQDCAVAYSSDSRTKKQRSPFESCHQEGTARCSHLQHEATRAVTEGGSPTRRDVSDLDVDTHPGAEGD